MKGVIGPVAFDKYGDITGPFRLWRIQNGEITTVGEMSTDDVNAVKAKTGPLSAGANGGLCGSAQPVPSSAAGASPQVRFDSHG